ncbi:MAG TPA: histidine phosphatase family protein [Niabella sp.]|nr:histidine phosphatase family protein [Niabella sp.]HOZ96509.1 histidine phosphatase family protein [Niabella sp.]HQW13310.1 histidine phosphatase family protein [Niabella sp.]HQX18650.1 histidine phosphatase family protein [Niabella sp.]HQX40303.1 histidine phosphatase family protein [Niabella sp.]
MKTLIIIRHAKAEQSLGADSHRKLIERGHRDAEMMAKKALSNGYKIDKIFSSPSERTKQTAQHFAQVHGVAEDDIRYFEALYLGDTLQILETVNWLQENVRTLAVIAHNPGVTNFTNDITQSQIDSLPTSGIAIVDADCDEWQEFNHAQKILVETLFPKD